MDAASAHNARSLALNIVVVGASLMNCKMLVLLNGNWLGVLANTNHIYYQNRLGSRPILEKIDVIKPNLIDLVEVAGAW